MPEMTTPSPMNDEEFEKYVGELINEADNHINSRIRPSREDAWRRYYGKVDAKPQNGGADIVVRSIQDASGSIIPELMDIFLSADTVTEFLPNSADEAEGLLCQAANLAVITAFWNAGGWLATHDSVSEAVVSGYGFYKVFQNEKYSSSWSEEYLDGDDYLAAAQNTQVEPMFDPQSTPMEDESWGKFKVLNIHDESELAIESVPASNVIWTYAQDISDSWLVGHVTELRRGDLVNMGFEPFELRDLTSKGRGASKIRSEEEARENNQASNQSKNAYGDSTDSWAAMKVAYYEVYVKADKDGDGKPECYKVWLAGDSKKVLRTQESHPDEMPFVQVPAYRIPNSTYSESLADRLKEFQEAETRMQRSIIDVSEMIAGPMILNAMGGGIDANTLAVWKANKIIDCRSPDAVKWLQPPDVGPSLLQSSQELKMRREDRSGVSRIASSLRPEDMADVQATVAAAAAASSEKKILHLARLQAELALKPLMAKILKILIKMGKLTINWQGQTIVINTKSFNPTWKLRVKVGLGTGTRVERSATMMNLWQALTQVCTQLGEQNAVTDIGKLRNLVEDYGRLQPGLNVNRYINTPEQAQQVAAQKAQQPPPPDPATVKAEADKQIAQMRIQSTTAVNQAKLQANTQIQLAKIQQKAQDSNAKLTERQRMAATKLQADFRAQMERIDNEYELNMRRLNAEMEEAAAGVELEYDTLEAETDTDRMKIAADTSVKMISAENKSRPNGRN